MQTRNNQKYFDEEECVYQIGTKPLPVLVEAKVTEDVLYHVENMRRYTNMKAEPSLVWKVHPGNYSFDAKKWYLRTGTSQRLGSDKNAEWEEYCFSIPLDVNNGKYLAKKLRSFCDLVQMDKTNTDLLVNIVMQQARTYMTFSVFFICQVALWDPVYKNWKLCPESNQGMRFSITDFESLAKRNALHCGVDVDQSPSFPGYSNRSGTWIRRDANRTIPLFGHVEEKEEERCEWEYPKVKIPSPYLPDHMMPFQMTESEFDDLLKDFDAEQQEQLSIKTILEEPTQTDHSLGLHFCSEEFLNK